MRIDGSYSRARAQVSRRSVSQIAEAQQHLKPRSRRMCSECLHQVISSGEHTQSTADLPYSENLSYDQNLTTTSEEARHLATLSPRIGHRGKRQIED
jgi:hypothetical protein